MITGTPGNGGILLKPAVHNSVGGELGAAARQWRAEQQDPGNFTGHSIPAHHRAASLGVNGPTSVASEDYDRVFVRSVEL
ncbi:MAG: hypothetical protein ACC619_04390 [Paracoccaceae bacterium]